jgi:hypothetical protein
MSNFTFVIVNYDNKIFNVSINETINDFRKKLAKELFNSENYIELEYLGKTPIRGFGKLTLEPGNIPEIYNNCKFERFNVSNKTIHINIFKLDKKHIEPSKQNSNSVNNGIYLPPSVRRNDVVKQVEFKYEETDFPALK